MNNVNTNGAMSSATYFILGLAAGGAAALLFAPASGQETRERIKQGYDEGAAKVANGVNEGKKRLSEEAARIEDAFQAGKAKLADGVNDGKKRIAEEAARIDNALQAGKAAYTRA